MKEGWFGEKYFILFDEEECIEATERYQLPNYL
jgi:hypothetical protein